jgi:hypothetical protein
MKKIFCFAIALLMPGLPAMGQQKECLAFCNHLFALMSGGYWCSGDLPEREFVKTDEILAEEYALTVIRIGDTLYFLASSAMKSSIYKLADPLSEKWSVAADNVKLLIQESCK